MKAILCEDNKLKLATTKILSLFSPGAFWGKHSPVQLRDIPEPELPAEDWAVVDTRVCGLCGSDYKQVFMHGTLAQCLHFNLEKCSSSAGFIRWRYLWENRKN